jgi:hypothetical protein
MCGMLSLVSTQIDLPFQRIPPFFDDAPKLLWKTLGAKLGKGLSKFWTS